MLNHNQPGWSHFLIGLMVDAKRLNIDPGDVKEKSVEDSDFPDMALGAAEDDEMSGQMITRGWRIKLEAQGQTYEYRADKNQVRAYKFKGKNHRV